jgi:phage head maturation protease
MSIGFRNLQVKEDPAGRVSAQIEMYNTSTNVTITTLRANAPAHLGDEETTQILEDRLRNAATTQLKERRAERIRARLARIEQVILNNP